MQGFATVASMVVFVDGRPEKARYRTYKVRAPAAAGAHPPQRRLRVDVRGAVAAAFAGRGEARRRATTHWKLPDLIVVDGGKGQLAMALAAARDVGIAVGAGAELSIVALAKERRAPTPPGEPCRRSRRRTPKPAAEPSAAPRREPAAAADAPAPGEPRRRPREATPAGKKKGRSQRARSPIACSCRTRRTRSRSAQQRRDVRAAAAARRGAPLRGQLPPRPAAAVDPAVVAGVAIPGIGATRQRQLLRHFGSLKRVREAPVGRAGGVPGMTRSAAEAVFAHWAGQPLAVIRGIDRKLQNDAEK